MRWRSVGEAEECSGLVWAKMVGVWEGCGSEEGEGRRRAGGGK
jgi:hypothetical protein